MDHSGAGKPRECLIPVYRSVRIKYLTACFYSGISGLAALVERKEEKYDQNNNED